VHSFIIRLSCFVFSWSQKETVRPSLELLKSEKTDKEFLSLVKEGIVLWDEMKHRQQIGDSIRNTQNSGGLLCRDAHGK